MNIYDVDLQETLEQSFLTYSGHVIQDRSIPDARDALKKGARQLLYSQYKEGYTHDKKMSKAAKSVSAATGLCYVHGDASAYGTIIRMGKPFAYRYPLQDVQGNVGNQSVANNHSAMRYVELRSSALADEMTKTLKKKTVETWKNNYDDTALIPTVLPSIGFYNIVNGSTGIAVGMSTSIPQFNLREVNRALVKLIENPDAAFEELYCPIDFATGGTVVNEAEVKDSLRTGNGKSARVRATIDYDVKTNRLIVKEMPYGVFVNTVCGQLGQLIEENPNCGIERFLDATNDQHAEIRIELSKGRDPEKMKEWLYKNTSLEFFFGINMIMLDDGKVPKLFGWKEALEAHIAHIRKIKRNEFQYDLNAAIAKKHILDGLMIALEDIDNVIALIRSSNDGAEAKLKLRQKYNLSDEQAKAILDIKLQRLAKLEKIQIQKEIDQLVETISRLNSILASQSEVDKYIVQDIESVTKRFGDERRTTNLNIAREEGEIIVDAEDKKVVVTISSKGFILMEDVEKHNKGKKKPVKLMAQDYLIDTIYSSTLSSVMLLTNIGKSYTINLSSLIMDEEAYLQNFVEMGATERVVKVIGYDKLDDIDHVVIVTKKGQIKKSNIEEYKSRKKGGLTGIKLKEGDEVAAVLTSYNDDAIFIVTHKGQSIRYNLEEISTTGRATAGVKAIGLGKDDWIAGADIIKDVAGFRGIITITEQGTIKLADLNDFQNASRTSKGTTIQNLKDDFIADVAVTYGKENGIIVVTSSMTTYVDLKGFGITTRTAIGSPKAVKLKKGDRILHIAQVNQ